MLRILPDELKKLAAVSPHPLYVVGGSVRDFLAGLTPAVHDWDICSPASAEEFAALAAENGFLAQAVYKNTGTVKLKGAESEYEYSCFRSDRYVRGTHVPVEIFFTEDITLDARRRDFTANAVYFDVKANTFVDPLNGRTAIKKRRLVTVADADKVFGEDGLRLLRLARQAAQLGFTPVSESLLGAKNNAALIQDISPERILEELYALLTADTKCGIPSAPYRGLRILDEIGVLDYILPELALGRGLAQRADFHKYDVLEHSFKAVDYMETLSVDPVLRLAALLHDVGKPRCMLRDGNAFAHVEEGVDVAAELLQRLKVSKQATKKILWLVQWHMYDYNCKTSENKLRRFFVTYPLLIEDLLLLKQADFSACVDDTSPAPTCIRWRALLAKMREEGVPFSLKELAVDGKDIEGAGIAKHHISGVLTGLLLHLAVFPDENTRERLLRLAKGIEKSVYCQE